MTLRNHDATRSNLATVEVNGKVTTVLLDPGCELEALINASLVDERAFR